MEFNALYETVSLTIEFHLKWADMTGNKYTENCSIVQKLIRLKVDEIW